MNRTESPSPLRAAPRGGWDGGGQSARQGLGSLGEVWVLRKPDVGASQPASYRDGSQGESLKDEESRRWRGECSRRQDGLKSPLKPWRVGKVTGLRWSGAPGPHPEGPGALCAARPRARCLRAGLGGGGCPFPKCRPDTGGLGTGRMGPGF